jgi:hypothetical protein
LLRTGRDVDRISAGVLLRVGAQYITGPPCLLLLLDLQDERIGDPFVVPRNEDQLDGNPDVGSVRAAVLAGTDEANNDHGTSWHPLEIRSSFSSWDKSCNLMRWAAKAIIERLATQGSESFVRRD